MEAKNLERFWLLISQSVYSYIEIRKRRTSRACDITEVDIDGMFAFMGED